MKLKREQKKLTREVARDLWIQFAGDIVKCRRAFRKDPRLVGFDISTIALMLQIALTLWRLWKGWNMSEPPIVATQAEAPALGEDYLE